MFLTENVPHGKCSSAGRSQGLEAWVNAVQPPAWSARASPASRYRTAISKTYGERDPCHQRYSPHDRILFAISKGVARPRQRTFEKTEVSQKMRFSGLRQFKAVVLDPNLDWEPIRFTAR
jgi:hypothetical protein